MATSGKATLHGLFSLKEDTTLEAFLPALDAYLHHLQAAGYVLRWRVEQRQVLGHFDRGLPEFTHYIAIEFPDLAHDEVCYQYVSGRTEPVHSLHVAQYQQVRPGARFFPHLRPGPAVNIGPKQVSCCGGAGPQAAYAQRSKVETPASLCCHCHLTA